MLMVDKPMQRNYSEIILILELIARNQTQIMNGKLTELIVKI